MSGGFRAIPAKVTVNLGKGGASDKFELEAYVPISEKIEYAILGMHNFFDRYEVTINAKKKKIKLKRN
ncbi:MAG: hypothetical protein JW834_01735 [Candidatus Diapherotrites archaeon]|nr:hypothetical protein [Candidatus Diapherotrites archaeon]